MTHTLLQLDAIVYVADIADSAPHDLVGRRNVHFTFCCDVTKPKSCEDFINSITGRLDGLVNCAGISGWEGIIGTDETYRRTMAINVTGTWNMTTLFLRRMSTQADSEVPGIIPGSIRSVGQGSIVNVGSGASLRGVSGLAAYTASKHAVLGLTRSWAKDFPKLRINLVAPGTFGLQL